jgi:hypothetical protein
MYSISALSDGFSQRAVYKLCLDSQTLEYIEIYMYLTILINHGLIEYCQFSRRRQ